MFFGVEKLIWLQDQQTSFGPASEGGTIPTASLASLFLTPLLLRPQPESTSTSTLGNISGMAYTIEVPGEAVPLSPQQVYLALQSAGSSQQLSIQTGTQQLQTWETQRGYYSLLQVCYLV